MTEQISNKELANNLNWPASIRPPVRGGGMTWYGYPFKCDTCGKFMRTEPGASWVRVPATDIPGDFGDERDRCKSCTENHGPAECSGKYVKSICCGIYGEAS